MSILSLAIQQQKKKQNSAGGTNSSPANTVKAPTLLSTAIQSKKAGNRLPSALNPPNFSGVRYLGPGATAALNSVKDKSSSTTNTQSQPIRTGPDDNSLAYQMLKDRAASEQNQQFLPLAQRIQNISTPGVDSISKYAELVKSSIGTPAQDAYNDYLKQHTDYQQYLKAPDFQKYSMLGAGIKNPSFSDAQGLFSLFGLRPGAQEVGNIVTFSRDNLKEINEKLDSDGRSDFVGNILYSFMSEDEVGIYNYLLAKEGKDAAARYIEAIEETLNARYGAKVAENVNNSKALKPILTAGIATSAGLDQYLQEMKQLTSEYRQPTSAIQFAGQDVRNDQGTLGRVAYDVINQTSHMAPSILVSYVAGALGAPAKAAEWLAAASTGLAAAGGSYNQALAEGRSKDEAKTVAALVGASEAVLSKLLSGVSAYGGFSAEKLLPKVAAIENAAWRVLGAAGVKIGGEVAEEELQALLEPLFKTIVYGDEYDIPTIGELVYTAFVTALSTGLLEGGNIAQYRTPEGARREAGVDQTEGTTQSQSKSMENTADNMPDSTVPAGSQSVSEVGSTLGRGESVNAPVAPQADTQGIEVAPATQETVPQITQTQQNEKSAAQTQRDVSESNTGTDRMSKLDTGKKAPGFYSNGKFTGSNEDAKYLDNLAKAAGISLEMSDGRNGLNGWIMAGKAYLSESAEDPLRFVAKHEITHHLQDTAGDAYNQYRSYVEQIYRERGSLDQQIAAIRYLYQKNGTELTREAALDELAADYAGELMENEALIRRLAGENRPLGMRILDAIHDLLRRFRSFFSSTEVKQLEHAARLWENALKEANAKKNTTSTGGEIRYSFKDDSIERTFLDYNDAEATADAIADTAGEIRREGGTVNVLWEDVERYAGELDWSKSNQKAARKFVQNILTDVLGDDSVTFSIKNGTVVAHLTGKGKDHYTSYATPQKAALAEQVRELISTARYAYSAQHDEHSKMGSTSTGQPGWDNFVAVVQIEGGPYDGETVPFVIATREIERDARAQIYDMQIKTEMATSREGRPVETGGRSSYGGFTISADKIAQDSAEVKGSRDPDERRSVKGSRDLQKQISALERQNQRLKEQMKRTDVPKVRRDVVKRSVKDFKSMYNSKIDADVLTDRIETLYNQIAKLSGAGNLQELKGIPSWTEVRAEARSIADAILAESRANVNPMAEEYGEIRRELRGRKISISDEYRSDLESAGGYEGIRKKNFGVFTLTRDGVSIDTVYEELNEAYPTLFPDDIINPADQLIRLSDVLEELKAVEGNPFENDLEWTAQYLAGEIEERFYDTPNQKPTLADKMANTYHRQRLKDQKELRAKLANQRRAYEQQVDSIHNQYAQENRTRIENQNAAQRRETIYRHANRLGKMLARPTNKRHIPEELRGAAVHMLNLINTGSNYQVIYGQDAMYHRVAPGEVLGAEDTSRTAAARALKAVYEDILKEGDLRVDPDITDYLEKLARLGNKPLGDMTRAELDTVWRVLQVVEHSITRANELHGEGRYRTVESMANALRDNVGSRKDRTNWAGAVGVVDQLLNRDMITPETFFHVLGDVGDNIFHQMRRSADRQTRILKEGADRAAQLIQESGVKFKKLDKEHHTFHLKGGDLTLSTSQLMELYALNKRKQAMEHIYVGGLKSVGGVKGFKETGRSKPVKVTPEDVGNMLETLTDQQKKLMDGLQAYLSGDLAKHGNEESMKVYGYEKFKEKNYWPIKVSNTETKSDPTSKAHSKTIPGYGMTKELTPMASNSVELRSAIDTFAAHLNQMATYASWLGTNEDVTRLHNFKFTDDNMNADGTVKELFERIYGKRGSEYLDNLLSDIAQGTKTGTDKTPLEGMFGRWKAAKVGGNLRVIIQQPTAILRAMSMVNPRFLAPTKSPKAGWKKALKYSEIAQWKDWGYFEMDTGRSVRELITGTESGLDKTKNFFMWGAGAADSLSWGHLWNAVESETAAKHKELAKGSKEFYEAVAERFAEVVDRTQVVDSVLHRTQIMRSSSYAAKLSTSFMSEPSKIYNMVVRDLYDMKNAPTTDARKKAGKKLARTTSFLIVSFAINAAAQSLIDGLRDDDRDKKYGEKFADAMLDNFISNFNLLSYLPYLKDISSMIEGYTMERSDLEGIADVVTAVSQLGKAISGESTKSVLNAGMDAVCRLGDLMGLPVSNLKREAESIFNTVLVEASLQELRYKTDKLLYNPEKAKGVFVSDLYRAMDTDPEAYRYIWNDLQTMPIENIASSVESRMKEDLALDSVKSLPIRFSAPGEDPAFDALMQQAAKSGKEWFELLPPGSVELAQELDALGTDAKKLQRVVEIGGADYDDDVKYAALQLTLTDSEFEQFKAARKAGIKISLWTEIYKAVSDAKVARTGKTGEPSQADVEKALNKFRLTTAQWWAIWKSYGWKSDCPR